MISAERFLMSNKAREYKDVKLKNNELHKKRRKNLLSHISI